MNCPKCKSEISLISYRGTKCKVCKSCGYDERDILDITPDQKSSQKSKHSPYKSGGPKRSK